MKEREKKEKDAFSEKESPEKNLNSEPSQEDAKKVKEVEKQEKEELENLKRELAEMKERWLRTAAEFENAKKRWLKEKESIIKYALVDLFGELLPLLDNMDKAIENLPEEKGDFEKGVEIIFKQIYTILKSYGLVRIDDLAGKEFDPFEHEAISYEENAQIPEGKIIEILRPGYKLRDRLLRPALVKVSKGKSKEEEKKEVRSEEDEHSS